MISRARIPFLPIIVLCVGGMATAQAETVTYFATDHLGSPVATMDSSGSVIWRESYSPYGEKLEGPSGADNDTGFTGHQSDVVTGLTYMQARYYGPTVGRFMAVDPVGFTVGNPMSFNRYSYANSDPFRYIDPTGMTACLNTSCTRSSIDADVDGDGTTDVTFVNDDSSKPPPPNDLDTAMAVMVEDAIRDSGVDSVNINSTTGGIHGPSSRHPNGKAVDIDTVNGKPADSSNSGVAAVQGVAARQSNIRENYGPSRQEKTVRTFDPKTGAKGSSTSPKPNQAATHKRHIHLSGQ